MWESDKVKFKKQLSEKQQWKIMNDWGYYDWGKLRNEVDGEVVKYKYKLSIKENKYMKLWDDLELKLKIHKRLWNNFRHKDILWSFTDENNMIDFYKFNKFMTKKGWQSSNLTAIKNRFIKMWFIKEEDWEYYFNPVLWIKTTTINQDLIRLFEEEIKDFGIIIKLSKKK